MTQVLTYNRGSNRNNFLDYTEKTIHRDHGNMYRITTASGHVIEVTDDHSLATNSEPGSKDLFKPLEPAQALTKLVPVVMSLDIDGDPSVSYGDDEDFVVDDRLVSASQYELDKYLSRHFDRPYWSYTVNDDRERMLMLIAIARLGLYVCIDGYTLRVDTDNEGYVPEGFIVVQRYSSDLANPYRWLPYTWSAVIDVEVIEREEVTYDFTVPEYPLFIGNMILVYDTMQVHVPVSEEARQEALDKMLPSKNLFSVRTGDPMMLPQQEAVFGMFSASKPAAGKVTTVSDIAKLKHAIEYGDIKPNAPVLYKGHKSTAGCVLLNDLLPEKYRDYSAVWDKKHMTKILTAIGKETPAMYTKVADGFKELGSEFAYQMGTTFKAKDLDLDDVKRKRDAMFKITDRALDEIDKMRIPSADKYTKKVEVLREAQKHNQKLTQDATYNAFNQWSVSGSKGSIGQIMQIITSPTIVADPRDRVVPIPIKRSYNEGLTPAEYWVSSYGTRKGTVAAKLSVAPGGMMAKEIIGNALDIVISKHDCGTKDGVVMPLSDRRDIVGRYEAGTNKLLNAAYIESLHTKGVKEVKVRSTMTCKAMHGVCQLCFGLNENGNVPEIGNNVGVQAAQALSEPLTQMALSAKHTAGTATEDGVTFPTVQRFFTMPNQYAGAALIASNSGKVTKIIDAPAGGKDIYIGTKKHHVVPGRAINVKVGDDVETGDILTGGVPNLSKIVPHKGIPYGRALFVNHAEDIYRRAGAGALRKNFEVVARGLVNYVEITDPGDFDFTEGEVLDYNALEATIHRYPGKKPPKYKPIQKGTTYAPQAKPDFLANFAFKYLKKNIIENAATGSRSELSSYHPVASYAAATRFGQGQDGKY